MSNIKVVGYTNPVILDCETAEDLVAYCARVSNPGNQANSLTAPKLLKYLATHGHWSPFEMVSVTMEINTTRDIARQILRHRSFSFQEFSQRYADPTQEFDDAFEFSEARLQDLKNRQNSIKTEDYHLQVEWLHSQQRCVFAAKREYEWAIHNGIAKEQARKVLPEGLTRSRLYMSGTLRSWIHYCELRSANGTQLEHQEIAVKARDEILRIFPSLAEVLNAVYQK